MEKKLQPLIVIAGPTGVGKSKLGVDLALCIGGEVVSCDSIQVYRRMNIGTAKITPSEMKGIPHYMIDVLEPEEPYDVVLFQKMAKEAIETIYSHGKIPILVGGTGFYIQSVLKDIDFTEEDGDPLYRAELEELARRKGKEKLHEMLLQVDPVSAEKIHSNNIKRTIRALEYYHKSGQAISLHNEEESRKSSVYDSRFFVLTDDRKVLYDRIDKRVDQMMADGLLDEVRSLLAEGCKADMTSMQGIGYKQLIPYIEGKCDLNSAVLSIKQDSRHYAKRQLTWFRREEDTIWLDRQEYPTEEVLLQKAIEEIKNK